MTAHIFCIVEGHGEERAIPNIIRRYLNYIGVFDISIFRPYRMGKGKFTKTAEILEVIHLGCSRIRADFQEGDSALVLIICDSDGDCPVDLRRKIEESLIDKKFIIEEIHVVICHCEFETWFLAGSQSFSGNIDCKSEIPHFDNPEKIRDAKGIFEKEILKEGRYYSETVDQQKFASLLDFSLHPENESRSLRRFIDVIDRLRKPVALR